MKNITKLYIAAALVALCLCGCGKAAQPQTLPSAEPTLPFIAETMQETLAVTEEAAALAEAPEPALPVVLTAQASGKEGMVSMDKSILSLYQQGKITRDTALHFADRPEQLQRNM